MKKERIAVIDLGTNTFNLLIAETEPGQMREIYFEKIPVKLGKGGIHKGTITSEAQHRALDALRYYKKVTGKYQVRNILAFGTAALRGADNAKELLNKVREETGLEIQIISGDEEASLIYTGVIHSIHPKGIFLIMDIGGGSVEFILASDTHGVLWEHSYPLGVARLLEEFELSDPVTEENIQTLENYLDSELQELWEQTSRHHPVMMVGAAGTFDTLRALATGKRLLPETNSPWQEIPLKVYQTIHRILLRSNATARKKMKGMEAFRVEMIVPASIFVNFVLRKTGISTFCQSYYSLKEGIVFRWMDQEYAHKK